jgi:hypothetical protein
MRKFKHPIDLKAAADAASFFVPVDVTLAELVQAHSLAKPRLELELWLRKWCDPVHGFGHESAWSISSERLQKAAEALVESGYATSTVNRDIGALGQVYRWAVVNRRMAPRGFISPHLPSSASRKKFVTWHRQSRIFCPCAWPQKWAETACLRCSFGCWWTRALERVSFSSGHGKSLISQAANSSCPEPRTVIREHCSLRPKLWHWLNV